MNSPYNSQSKFKTPAAARDRTFQGDLSLSVKGQGADVPETSVDRAMVNRRPVTVAATTVNSLGGDFSNAWAQRTDRPSTVGFGSSLRASTGFDGPYHVSPERVRIKNMLETGNLAETTAFVDTVLGEENKLASTQQVTFVDNRKVSKTVEQHSWEDYEQAFYQLSDPEGRSISVFDVERLIKLVMGEDVPRWIIEIFVVMCRDRSQFRRVSLENFR